MWTLFQNQTVIKNAVTSLELQKVATSNAIQQLQIEVETRKNPELECAFYCGQAFTNYGFVLRNVGNAAATNIYLRVSVACVTSNSVYTLQFFNRSSSSGENPLVGKLFLNPGDQAAVQDFYVPVRDWLEETMLHYSGDVLVRLYVEYERPSPNFRRYSGCFVFIYDRPGLKLQAGAETPRLQQALDRFSSIPPANRFLIAGPADRTNPWHIYESVYGRDVGGMQSDSPVGAIKILNWTKHN